MQKSLCQLGLNISDFWNSNIFDKSTNSFINLFSEKLFKSIGSKVVKEGSCIFFKSVFRFTDMEVDSNIKLDQYIIFCRYIFDGCIEPYSIAWDHDWEIFPARITALEARWHNSIMGSKDLLQYYHAMRNAHHNSRAIWFFSIWDNYNWNPLTHFLWN